jgi:hypothetical protein
MNDLVIAGGISTPSVRLDARRGLMELSGESYPENAFDFYAPVLEWARQFLSTYPAPLRLELRMSYLNTSSTKCLIDLLDMMEEAHRAGRDASVAWFCDRDNERARESAEEFREDVSLPFEIVLEGPSG